MADNVTELTSENFKEKVKAGNWIIDFWAPWCGPCKMMSPEFEKASKDIEGKAFFGKVNVDECGELAQDFDVMSIPTLVVLRQGKEVDRISGALPRTEIVKLIEKNIK